MLVLKISSDVKFLECIIDICRRFDKFDIFAVK